MPTGFDDVLSTYPRDPEYSYAVDAAYLTRSIEQEFQVQVPEALKSFWDLVGAGYFGKDRDLYFFGEGLRQEARDSLVVWGKKDFWGALLAPPSSGGPLWFAETCFGDQIGFRWNEGVALVTFLCVDTFEAVILANDFPLFFSDILAEPGRVIDPALLRGVVERLGRLPAGKHYGPIVSPLIGGSERPGNFHFESPNAHLRIAIATYAALGG